MIDLQHISKSFRVRSKNRQEHAFLVALDDVSLSIAGGTFFGLIGPNGAGKTTLQNIIATLLLPDSGKAYVGGIDVVARPNDVRRQIGVVQAGDRSLYWKLSAEENLRYFARLYAIDGRLIESRITEVLQQVGLSQRRRDYVERFSTGMRKRLIIARALLHNPKILLLDEPTANIDPIGTDELHNLLKKVQVEGNRTVLLTTNDLREAEVLCDDLAIINKGKLIARSSPDELKARTASGQKYVIVSGTQEAGRLMAETISSQSWCQHLSLDEAGTTLEVCMPSNTPFSALLAVLSDYGEAVLSVKRVDPRLEDVFRLYVQGEQASAS